MTRRLELGEALDARVGARFEADVSTALRRKPAQEARLAGALRELAGRSQRLRALEFGIVETLVKRGTFARPLYAAAVRGLCQHAERRGAAPVRQALASDDAGGLATLSGSCFLRDGGAAEALARIAASRHPQLAFASEVARVARGEANGAHVASLAPKIKEAHRIELCVEVLVPLLWGEPLPAAIAPSLAVLRDAERHLGRWLVLGELAVRAGDPTPLDEARERARSGPSSARAAWTLVAWALDAAEARAPTVRPTVELVSRLSDRPSADRDLTFLFRLAHARVPTARSMLENLLKGATLEDELAVRAALYLARDHARDELRGALAEAARTPRREALRGLAAAALYDAGERAAAAELAEPLLASRQVPTVAWGALVLSAHAAGDLAPLVTEPSFRRIQLGWVE
ncbi:MAG: hypothetical protein OZ921_14395 [Sorangiineae bacterium]|nr:hypothetical protein [Polyangiaceae bacterium]MEB2323698.1 hypothetical protein [Sorangiineae bacterium]